MKAVFTTQLNKSEDASVDTHDMPLSRARSNLAALPVKLQDH
jgi:hypothetical protein